MVKFSGNSKQTFNSVTLCMFVLFFLTVMLCLVPSSINVFRHLHHIRLYALLVGILVALIQVKHRHRTVFSNLQRFYVIDLTFKKCSQIIFCFSHHFCLYRNKWQKKVTIIVVFQIA